MYFPPGKKYVALFVGEEDEVTVKSRARLMELAKKHKEVSCNVSEGESTFREQLSRSACANTTGSTCTRKAGRGVPSSAAFREAEERQEKEDGAGSRI